MIRLTLSSGQMYALQQLLKNIPHIDTRKVDLPGMMMLALMLELYIKIYSRTLIVKHKSTLTLTKAQGIAFILYFSQADLKKMPFENALITELTTSIHQKTI